MLQKHEAGPRGVLVSLGRAWLDIGRHKEPSLRAWCPARRRTGSHRTITTHPGRTDAEPGAAKRDEHAARPGFVLLQHAASAAATYGGF
ncbi:MAG: hypothetical protein AB2A00_31500 [Myxococcota bacterium]